jgi:hypothetical protein
MAELCDESGVIYVLDRGYVDYKSLYTIDLQGSTFVTHMKSNDAFKWIKNNPHEKNGVIISDVLIRLTGTKTKTYYPKPTRKIKYYDKKYHHMYEFITNNMEMAAQNIADIYKRRWQVELFFKWITQNLKIKLFWGTNMNAVFSQIWAALIISILLWIGKTLDGITASAHQILQMIKTTLLSKGSILDLCTCKPPPPKIIAPQFLLESLL